MSVSRAMVRPQHHTTRKPWDWGLWRRWVLANSIGELAGLGVAAIIGVIAAQSIETTMNASARLVMAAVMILAGTFEGVVVGVAQWVVLRRPIPNLSWRAWALATAVGAFAAWALGMIPGTIMTGATDSSSAPQETSHLLMFGLAALMGALLGTILGIPQWLALRRHVQSADWWVFASAAAWAVAMPIIFAGAGAAPHRLDLRATAVIIVTIASAGAVAGAIHGLALVALLRSHVLVKANKDPSPEPVVTQECSHETTPFLAEVKTVARLPRKGEVLLVAALALAAYTSLMLKMPYRAPITNSLYTVICLSAIYLYFRLRLGIRVPTQALLCLVIGALLDIIGNQFDLFSRGFFSIPYDSITHFITCSLTFVVVMWLVMALMNRYGYQLPLGFLAFFSATTTYSLSAYYEITELLDERFFGGHRMWTPHDTVQDLAVDLAGITVAAIGYTLYLKRRRPLRFQSAIRGVDK